MLMNLLKTPVGRFRIVAFLEGLSYLVLVFIAMPLKYFYEKPLMNKYVGMAHGWLFILFIALLIQVSLKNKWPLTKSFLAFLASLIPFGTFILDAKVLKNEPNQ